MCPDIAEFQVQEGFLNDDSLTLNVAAKTDFLFDQINVVRTFEISEIFDPEFFNEHGF